MAQNQSLSTQEVADMLHVSKSTIYDLIRRGEIHSYKIGRKVRFTQDDVDAYIARSRHEHSTRPVQRIDTHSTLLTPRENEAPELIVSGQDVVLDIQLKKLGIPASKLRGYDRIMGSHLTMAAAIAAGDADLAIGTERISRQMENLDFIPLLEERFDLVIKKDAMDSEPVKKLLEILNAPVFRREVERFSGNDYRDLGKVIVEV